MYLEQNLENLFELLPTISDSFFVPFFSNNPYMKENNLNPTHVKTLMSIRFLPNSPMSVISQKVELEKGSFTPVANKLFEMGFIQKLPCETDKRKSVLSLTPKGYDFTEKFKSAHTNYVASQLKALSPAEQELFFASIKMVLTLSKKITD